MAVSGDFINYRGPSEDILARTLGQNDIFWTEYLATHPKTAEVYQKCVGPRDDVVEFVSGPDQGEIPTPSLPEIS